MNAPPVVGVGNALLDRTYRLTNLPEPDGGAFVREYEERPGGVETNVAVHSASLGHDAGIVARLGRDRDGDAVREHLADLGLDRRRVRQCEGDTTSYCLVLTDPEGERVIIGGGDSTLNLSLSDADLAYVDAARVAVSSAYVPVDALRDLASSDTPLVFDLAGRFEDLEHRGLTRRGLDDVLPGVDCFVANVAAARSYVDRDASPRELAAELRARGCPRGAVTRGDRGALLFDAEDTYRIPAIEVDVVDTTGAGDAFTAGLIHAWLLGDRPAREAGRFAAAAAAHNCTVRGAHDDPPRVADVEALLDRD